MSAAYEPDPDAPDPEDAHSWVDDLDLSQVEQEYVFPDEELPDDPGPEPRRTGQQRRDDGMARVEAHANPEWKDAFPAILREIGLKGQPFNGDEINLRMDELGIFTHDRRSMGPALKGARKDGLIEETGVWRQSIRPASNMRRQVLYVWTGPMQ